MRGLIPFSHTFPYEIKCPCLPSEPIRAIFERDGDRNLNYALWFPVGTIAALYKPVTSCLPTPGLDRYTRTCILGSSVYFTCIFNCKPFTDHGTLSSRKCVFSSIRGHSVKDFLPAKEVSEVSHLQC